MTMWAFLTIVFFTILGVLGFIVYAAMEGSVIAIVFLTVLAVLVLAAFFQSFNLAFTIMRDRQERIRMQDDMKEDMLMMQGLFKTQAAQAQAQQRLLSAANIQEKNRPALVSSGGLFDDFEEGDYE